MRTIALMLISISTLVAGCSQQQTEPEVPRKTVELTRFVVLKYDEGVKAEVVMDVDGNSYWTFSGTGDVDIENHSMETNYTYYVGMEGENGEITEWIERGIGRHRQLGFKCKPEWQARHLRLPSER